MFHALGWFVFAGFRFAAMIHAAHSSHHTHAHTSTTSMLHGLTRFVFAGFRFATMTHHRHHFVMHRRQHAMKRLAA